MDRTETGWGNLTYFIPGMYVSTTNDGSIYLTDFSNYLGLVKIPFDGTEFGERTKLNGGPNKPVRGIHPCIAKDESFIIYDCQRPDGYGGEGVEFGASLSLDGKYLFFTKNDDLYWVDIAVIEPFRSLATK